MASCLKKLKHAYSANEIESLAAVMVLSLAMEIGIKSAVLKRDSLVLIKALKDNACTLASLGVLVKDVKDMSRFFDQLLYSHTKREVG